MSDCLDANLVQDLMSDALDPIAKATAFGHLDTCADCRDLLTVLARESVRNSAEDAMRATLGTEGNGSGRNLATKDSAALAETIETSEKPKVEPELRKLGRYQLTQRLGAGAMGIVYRATDQELGRDVALKLLKRPDASFTDRLMREARSMAQVNHPNVVGVYDVGVAEGKTYIAMEHVQGQSLRQWQTSQRRTIPEIVEAYVAAGNGLAAAHAAGIIHRDFKPDNVLVGTDGRVRVTDFGLAAARGSLDPASGDALTDVDLTQSGSVLGTPAYMAPEQFTGGNLDPRTDQFNYCVALYEAVYGQRPFAGKSFEELGDNVCDGKIRPAPPKTSVSSALRAILLRGLAVRPGDRYATMDHLLVELGRDRARPWRRAATAGTVIAAVLGLGLVADYAVRDRVEGQIRESFAATGVQAGRAWSLLSRKFVASSNVAYLQPQIRDVSGHYDAVDFGLGDAATDSVNLGELHEILISADWSSWGKDLTPGPLAITDRKGRLLFTTTNQGVWGADMRGLSMVKRLLETNDKSAIEVLRADQPVLAQSQLLGTEARDDLWVMFARSLVVQDSIGALYLQFSSGTKLLDDIRLDKEGNESKTLLALVAPDGTFVPSSVPAALVHSARVGEIVTEMADGQIYEIQSIELHDEQQPAGKPIAHVVMARKLEGVLSGLFPGARTVFAIACALAIALALATALRARRLTGATTTIDID